MNYPQKGIYCTCLRGEFRLAHSCLRQWKHKLDLFLCCAMRMRCSHQIRHSKLELACFIWLRGYETNWLLDTGKIWLYAKETFGLCILGSNVEVWTSMGKLKMAQYKWDKKKLVLVNVQWRSSLLNLEET